MSLSPFDDKLKSEQFPIRKCPTRGFDFPGVSRVQAVHKKPDTGSTARPLVGLRSGLAAFAVWGAFKAACRFVGPNLLLCPEFARRGTVKLLPTGILFGCRFPRHYDPFRFPAALRRAAFQYAFPAMRWPLAPPPARRAIEAKVFADIIAPGLARLRNDLTFLLTAIVLTSAWEHTAKKKSGNAFYGVTAPIWFYPLSTDEPNLVFCGRQLFPFRGRRNFCAFLRHNHHEPSIFLIPTDCRFPTDDCPWWRGRRLLGFWRHGMPCDWRITAARREANSWRPPNRESRCSWWRCASWRWFRWAAADFQSGESENAVDDALLDAALTRIAAFGCLRCDCSFNDYGYCCHIFNFLSCLLVSFLFVSVETVCATILDGKTNNASKIFVTGQSFGNRSYMASICCMILWVSATAIFACGAPA